MKETLLIHTIWRKEWMARYGKMSGKERFIDFKQYFCQIACSVKSVLTYLFVCSVSTHLTSFDLILLHREIFKLHSKLIKENIKLCSSFIHNELNFYFTFLSLCAREYRWTALSLMFSLYLKAQSEFNDLRPQDLCIQIYFNLAKLQHQLISRSSLGCLTVYLNVMEMDCFKSVFKTLYAFQTLIIRLPIIKSDLNNLLTMRRIVWTSRSSSCALFELR